MPTEFASDFVLLAKYLLPGFLAAWLFYGLTSHAKPSQFERAIQALVLTFIIQITSEFFQWALVSIGSIYSLRPWDGFAEGLTSLALAVAIGSLLAYLTNTDGLHRRLRALGFTTRTSHPSEWYAVFSEKVTFVVLHLHDGRRLYGWPKEWPIEPDRGQFYIMLPSWIGEDGTQVDLTQLDGVLLSAKDVQWVEFVRTEEVKP